MAFLVFVRFYSQIRHLDLQTAFVWSDVDNLLVENMSQPSQQVGEGIATKKRLNHLLTQMFPLDKNEIPILKPDLFYVVCNIRNAGYDASLTVRDFSPSRCDTLFIQLGNSSHQIGLTPNHLAGRDTPFPRIVWQRDPLTSPPPVPEAFISPGHCHLPDTLLLRTSATGLLATLRVNASHLGFSTAAFTAKGKTLFYVYSTFYRRVFDRNTATDMSSACVIAKQTPFAVAPLARPLMMDTAAANDSCASLWRPWLVSSKEAHRGSRTSVQPWPYSRPSAAPANVSTKGKPQAFQHPVRLFWPRSKSFDYLYSDGETLLKNFPVQATISFYEESDSEEEEEEEEDWEEEDGSEDEKCLKPQSFYTSYN